MPRRHVPHCPKCSLFYIFLVMAAVVFAGTSTRTIDDQKGDSVTGLIPTYSGAWNEGPECTGCSVQPDPSQAFGGTWHDATVHPGDPIRTMTASFNGTAVTVYGILAHTIPYITTLTNVTFLLDNQPAGSFFNDPTSSTDYQYNVPMFSAQDLPNAEHTVTLEITGDTNAALILFDYITYTFVDPDPPPTIPTTTTNPTTSPQSTSPTHTSPQSSSTTSSSPGPSSNPATSSPLSSAPSASSIHSSSSSTSGGTQSPSHPSSNAASSSPSTPSAPSAAQHATSPTASPHRSAIAVGAIAGGVVGGIAILTLIATVLCCMRRRRRAAIAPSSQKRDAAAAPPHTTIHPFMAPEGPSVTAQSPLLDREQTSNSSSPTAVSALPSTISRWKMMSSHQGNGTGLDSHVDEAPDIRPLPDVPISPSGHSQSFDLGSSSALDESIPGMHLDSWSRTLTEQDSDYKSVPETSAQSPTTAAPRFRRLPRPRGLPSLSIRSPTPTSTSGTSTLRNQVALLQEEIARLREERELQRLLAEAPPEYVP